MGMMVLDDGIHTFRREQELLELEEDRGRLRGGGAAGWVGRRRRCRSADSFPFVGRCLPRHRWSRADARERESGGWEERTRGEVYGSGHEG